MSSIVKVDTIQENTSANGITVDGLNIKDSKLVTANSVVTSNITDANVTLAKLAGDSVNATKIADNAISEEHLDVTSITGHTAETSIADGDTILIHDASASALRKMTKANFVSGIGGANTPAWLARANTNQTLNDATSTGLAFGTEYYDTANGFASDKFTVPSGQGGKYQIYYNVNGYDAGGSLKRMVVYLYLNGSSVAEFTDDFGNNVMYRINLGGSIALDLSAGNYLQIYALLDTADGSTAAVVGSSEAHTYFGGYKLIE